jgi:hypothetical protein
MFTIAVAGVMTVFLGFTWYPLDHEQYLAQRRVPKRVELASSRPVLVQAGAFLATMGAN